MSALRMDDLPHQELLTLGGQATTPRGGGSGTINKSLLEDVSVQCLLPIGTTAIREKKARCNVIIAWGTAGLSLLPSAFSVYNLKAAE